MYSYTVAVEYSLRQSTMSGRTSYIPKSVLQIYDSRRQYKFIEQEITQDQCQDILHNKKNNITKEISSHSSLDELYYQVEDNILTIAVAYGGPKIELKITNAFNTALHDINRFHNNPHLDTSPWTKWY